MGDRRWTFGSAAFDERAMRLFVGGRAVELELKPLEVLRYLLEHRGEAVSKDDLVKAVWPGRVISDSALTSTIAKLREALNAEGEAIKTVHGFGYRFDADVRSVVGEGRPSDVGRGPGQPSRRLAAIMFTDLVGYSALAHRDEKLAIELLELHRSWIREILPRHGGKEIETVGDAFLVEFAGALAAVECAVAIQQRFAEHNMAAPADRRMELRIGIHLGDVEHKDGKVMGDGVNIASRIHGLAEPGHICVSEGVYHAVRNRIATPFSSLGSPVLKNISTSFEIFTMVAAGQPQATAAKARETVFRRRFAVPVAAAVALLALGVGIWKGTGNRAPAGPSVAVLPFENLSSEADSAYFTDGLHDTVIGHLARIKDLKVISRTSVMRYREQRINLRQIARELGVGHVVEGSVQRAGSRLRVVAQLIDTSSDTHLWSSEYDRDLADVFAVQADIARQVAAAVHARLTPRTAAAIARVPTENAAAYDLYLRALAVARKVEVDPKDVRQAIGWLEEAVALDPRFAEAWAELSAQHDTMYWFGYEPVPARAAQARQAADEALRVGPDLVESHVAKARILYHGSRDYDGALRELELAREIASGYHDLHMVAGAIYRRQARWDDAVAAFRRSVELDPLNGANLGELASTYERLGRYAEADTLHIRIEALGGDRGFVAYTRALNRFHRTGAIEPIEQVLAEIPPNVDPGCGPSHGRWIVAMMRRRFADAAAAIQRCAEGRVTLDARETLPTDALAALAWRHAGNEVRMRESALRARATLTRALKEDDDLPQMRMALARMLLLLGERDAALREIDRALAQMPLSRDALVGATLLEVAAAWHAQAGERERSLEELARAFALPNAPSAHALRLEPDFDPVRDDPRFQKLIAEHLPRT